MPILGMVDDVLAVNKCSNEAVISDCTINRFMELNKLTLSSTKCHRMHIGKQSIKCPELQIHESKMETNKQERYLGNIITCDRKQAKNINRRIAKAWSYFAEIKALINEFPFGKRTTQVGLMLREAMFLNVILYNSESWHGITQKHMEELALVDKNLIWFLLSALAKTPIEFLCLESGAKPVNFVISSRRLNFLKEIHMRKIHELLKRWFEAQQKNPLKGDWTELVEMDMEKCDIMENILTLWIKFLQNVK